MLHQGHEAMQSHRHFQEATKNVNFIRREDKFTDLHFICHTERSKTSVHVIKAHQAVFCGLSKMLKQIFDIAHEKQLYETVVITLDSFDPLIVEKFVDYIYEGQTIVNHQQQHELRDLCILLKIDVPLRYFDIQVPCSIIGSIVCELEISDSVKSTPTTFVAEFPSCYFYDDWKSNKEELTLSLEVESANLYNVSENYNGVKDVEIKKIKQASTIMIDEAAAEVRLLVVECVNNVIGRVQDSNMIVVPSDPMEKKNIEDPEKEVNKTTKITRKKDKGLSKECTKMTHNRNIQSNQDKRIRNRGLKSSEKLQRKHYPSICCKVNDLLSIMSSRQESSIRPNRSKENIGKFSKSHGVQKRVKVCLERINIMKPPEDIQFVASESNSNDQREDNTQKRLKHPLTQKKLNVERPLKRKKFRKDDAIYCLCRRTWDGTQRGMIGCDFCEEWFHPACLSLSVEEANKLTKTKWQCPLCKKPS